LKNSTEAMLQRAKKEASEKVKNTVQSSKKAK
jgi:hypothetical protein